MQRTLRRTASLLRSQATQPTIANARSFHAKTSQSITLRSGQTLGYAEFGSPDGFPVFYFHGTPGSRLEAKGWDEFATKASARFIGLDRPGMGLTSLLNRHETLLDWPDRVSQLADHMKFERLCVLGASGGGPFAIACAHALPPERLIRTGVAAGFGPVEYGYSNASLQRQFAFHANRYLPSSWLHWIIERSFVRPAQDPDPKVFEKKVVDKILKHVLTRKDAALFTPTEKEDLVDDWRQAFAQGAEGYVRESKNIFSPWPFRLADVLGEVRLWYGNEDFFTPLGIGKYLAEHLPNAKLVEMPGHSHFSICDEGENILKDLIPA